MKLLSDMLQDLYSVAMSRKNVVIDPCTVLLVNQISENNGVKCMTTAFKKVRFADDNKQFTYRDFDIATIMSVGAVQLLKPVSMANHDSQSFVDQVDSIAKGLDNALNSDGDGQAAS